MSPGSKLKSLMQDAMSRHMPVMAPGVFDGLSTKLADASGFQALYASGGAIARSMGLPDLGLVTMTEMADRLSQIVNATDCPVLADGDTGHGTSVHVRRTIRVFEKTGVAGLHIEDQGFPKRCGHLAGKSLIPVTEMTDKIKAALDARTDPDFLIAARTDAIAVEGFDPAIERAMAYRDAGADILFVEAPETAADIQAIPAALGAMTMINMFKGGKTPLTPLSELGEAGYGLVIVPSDLQRAVIATMTKILAEIRETGNSARLDSMLCALPERDTSVDQQDWLDFADRFGG